MLEKELGERNLGFDSLLILSFSWRRKGLVLYANGRRTCCSSNGRKMFSVDSCRFISGPCNFSDAPLFRPLGRMRPSPAGVQPEESAYDREVGTTEHQILFPQFHLHHGRDNPHYKSLLVVEVPESRKNQTGQSLRFIISENIPVSSNVAQ